MVTCHKRNNRRVYSVEGCNKERHGIQQRGVLRQVARERRGHREQHLVAGLAAVHRQLQRARARRLRALRAGGRGPVRLTISTQVDKLKNLKDLKKPGTSSYMIEFT